MLLVVVVLSACAAPQPAPDAHVPPFARVPYEPISRDAVVAIALREWRLFGSPVEWGYYGSKKTRPATYDCAWPTDRAAEVLYPTRIPLQFLQTLYVPGQQHRRLVNAWCEAFDHPQLPIEIDMAPFA